MPAFSDAASCFTPPATGNATETSCTAATATAAVATGVGETNDRWISVAVSQPFNILFGESGVAAPANTGVFPPGVHSFILNRMLTHFRVTTTANGTCLSWKSSRT
jgi:hypothetical protein